MFAIGGGRVLLRLATEVAATQGKARLRGLGSGCNTGCGVATTITSQPLRLLRAGGRVATILGMSVVRAGAVQFAAVPFAVEANWAAAERLARTAAGNG